MQITARSQGSVLQGQTPPSLQIQEVVITILTRDRQRKKANAESPVPVPSPSSMASPPPCSRDRLNSGGAARAGKRAGGGIQSAVFATATRVWSLRQAQAQFTARASPRALDASFCVAASPCGAAPWSRYHDYGTRLMRCDQND